MQCVTRQLKRVFPTLAQSDTESYEQYLCFSEAANENVNIFQKRKKVFQNYPLFW